MNKNPLYNPFFSGAYSITVPVGGAKPGDRIYLPDTPVLQNKNIVAINVFIGAGGLVDPDGIEIGGLDVNNFYLTLSDLENRNFIQETPLAYFSSGGKQIRIDRHLFLPDCYLTTGEDIPNGRNIFMTFFWDDEVGEPELPELEHPNICGIEVPVFSTYFPRFYFPDHRVLVGKKIRNIYSGIYSTETPSGRPSVNLYRSFVTMVYQNEIVLYRFPVEFFEQWLYPFRLRMRDLKFDLPSCYLELSPDIADTVGDSALYLNFEYEP